MGSGTPGEGGMSRENFSMAKEADMDRYVVIDPKGQVMGMFPDTPKGCGEAKEYAKRMSENSNNNQGDPHGEYPQPLQDSREETVQL